jgi:hypothetical protein
MSAPRLARTDESEMKCLFRLYINVLTLNDDAFCGFFLLTSTVAFNINGAPWAGIFPNRQVEWTHSALQRLGFILICSTRLIFMEV